MGADVLAPCIAKSLATMVLTVKDKWVLVIYKEYFDYLDLFNLEK